MRRPCSPPACGWWRRTLYAEGAPPGFSGGFKEESCHACHFHSEPNSGPGRVAIEGVPARFTAGERYTLIVTLTQAGMKRAGFQVTSRFKDTGAQAGTLAPAPDDRNRIGIDIQGGVQYAGQRKEGASVTAGEAVRWTIQWTAPDGGGPVAFNVAANAADGNESADGDFVYTTTAESASSGALALPSARCPDDVTALRHEVVEPVGGDVAARPRTRRTSTLRDPLSRSASGCTPIRSKFDETASTVAETTACGSRDLR